MKTILTIIIGSLALSLMGLNGEASAQIRYQEHSEVDGVTIEYKWARSSFFNRSSPLELRLKVKNNNDYPVNVNFQIEFYMGAVLEESSDETELCIHPKLAKTGRINGVYFQSSNLDNEEIESDDFSWEFRDFEVERVESCP